MAMCYFCLFLRFNLSGGLRGYKTNKLVPLTFNIPGVLTAKLDARLSLIPQENGQVGLAVHGIRKEPKLERPYFGFNFSEEDKKKFGLLKKACRASTMKKCCKLDDFTEETINNFKALFERICD